MPTVREFLEKIKFAGPARYDEPMAGRTTFRIGGPADAVAEPRTRESLAALLSAARAEGLPVFLLGGGANLLVRDGGIRGLVISTRGLAGLRLTEAGAEAEAGVPVTDLVSEAAEAGLSGLEFAAGLPGSVGGAVYMNARCYEREFADVLTRVDYLDPRGRFGSMVPDRGEWAYKRTPFMPGGRLTGSVVLGAEFRMTPGDRAAIRAWMRELEADRAAKGHFDFPCAGSVFKNDRRFGRPTGKILDELGFRGRTLGSAAVSEKHANIFVNPGAATAADMIALIETARREARERFGYELEPEVVIVGEDR
jgi:UDP-N-acetylmuramate dehydrogenase